MRAIFSVREFSNFLYEKFLTWKFIKVFEKKISNGKVDMVQNIKITDRETSS